MNGLFQSFSRPQYLGVLLCMLLATIIGRGQTDLTIVGLLGDDKIYDATAIATASGTATLAGVQQGDDVVLSGLPVFTFAASDAGTDITITTSGYTLSGADAGNYVLTQPSLQADITPRAITLTASGQSKLYGDVHNLDPSAFEVLDLDGDNTLPGGEAISSVTILSQTNVASSATHSVATYANELAIPATGLTGSNGFDQSNYSITYLPGDFAVTARPITVRPLGQDRTYGNVGTVDQTLFSVLDVDGDDALPNGEAIGSLTIASGNNAAASPDFNVGTYADNLSITAGSIVGANGMTVSNYDVTFLYGDYTINRRPVTLIADDQSKTYGESLTLGETAFSILDEDGDGVLPNGEAIDTVELNSATGAAASTTASEGVYLGEIYITPTSGSSPTLTGSVGFNGNNYDFSYEHGDLTILGIEALTAYDFYTLDEFGASRFQLTTNFGAALDSLATLIHPLEPDSVDFLRGTSVGNELYLHFSIEAVVDSINAVNGF